MLLVLTDDPALRARLTAVAQPVWITPDSAGDVVAYLTGQRPALVLIDTAARTLDWVRWALTAKTSPATRRIPLLAIGAPGGTEWRAQAARAGCDALIERADFLADIPAAIAQYARPDDSAALAQAAQLPLAPEARHALELFNAGEYFEQHEVFEALWRAEPGPIRQMYQGILQIGVAYLQIERGNYIGARKLFLRARQYLDALPARCQGVDIARLRADAAAALAALEALGPARVAEFPRALLRPVDYA